MSKSKLETAIRKKADGLDEVQRELVLSQFATYKQNKARLAEINMQLDAVNARQATTLDEVRFKQQQRATLTYEHNQLATANSQIATGLHSLLKEG